MANALHVKPNAIFLVNEVGEIEPMFHNPQMCGLLALPELSWLDTGAR